MTKGQPWHVPGKWFAVPAYWEPEVAARRDLRPRRVRFIDCTLREGEDATGCHLGWARRLEITRALDEIGIGEITVPGGATLREQKDYIRWCQTHGIKAPISVKGPGTRVPLQRDWKDTYKRHIDMGGASIVPIVATEARDVFSDYSGEVSKGMVVEAIQEVTRFATEQGASVVLSIGDSMRHRLDTAMLFYRSAIEAGAAGVYVWDSRGNSHPAATAHYVRRLRETVGSKSIYIQFHNDLGMATGNCLVAAENGADWLDASVLGVADRGGCVALEEAAAADLLLLVVDGAHLAIEDQLRGVLTILGEHDLSSKPRLVVVNKCDAVADPAAVRDIVRNHAARELSAMRRQGLSELMADLEAALASAGQARADEPAADQEQTWSPS